MSGNARRTTLPACVMRCRWLCGIAVLVTLAFCSADGQPVELGPRDDCRLLPPTSDDCASGTLYYHHDDSAENGYGWSFGWMPPYYGAFAEAFDLGAGTVECGAYWFSQIGYFYGEPMDAYVWDGGITRDPGEVLCVVYGAGLDNIPYWPDCGQNDIAIECCVSGEFTVGWWADFTDQQLQWYMCADENGPGGHPWTCIMPGIGYPTGWQHPEIVFGECQSLMIGAYFEAGPSPSQSPSWGRIKALF